MTEISGVKPALGPVPDGVEVYPRYGAKGAVYVLVNFSKTPQTVKSAADDAGCAERRIDAVSDAATLRSSGAGVGEVAQRWQIGGN